MRSSFVTLMLALTACGSAATTATSTTFGIATDAPAPTTIPVKTGPPVGSPIHIPISLYVVVSDTGPTSARTTDQVTDIGAKITDIWAQANIALDITVVGEIVVPADVIADVAARDGRSFLIAANQGRFEIPDPGAIIGFYVPDAGGANGFAPSGLRTFFVSDVSTVDDERVSSHEIGHILGLHHVLDDPDRLMFSGTNGTSLSPEEVTVVRYVTQGILDGLR